MSSLSSRQITDWTIQLIRQKSRYKARHWLCEGFDGLQRGELGFCGTTCPWFIIQGLTLLLTDYKGEVKYSFLALMLIALYTACKPWQEMAHCKPNTPRSNPVQSDQGDGSSFSPSWTIKIGLQKGGFTCGYCACAAARAAKPCMTGSGRRRTTCLYRYYKCPECS